MMDSGYTGICKSVCGHISFAKVHGALGNNAGIMPLKGTDCTSTCNKKFVMQSLELTCFCLLIYIYAPQKIRENMKGYREQAGTFFSKNLTKFTQARKRLIHLVLSLK